MIDDAPTYGKDSAYQAELLTETLKSINGIAAAQGLRDAHRANLATHRARHGL